MYGPDVLFPKVWNEEIVNEGIPHAALVGAVNPGIFSSPTTFRTNASSVPRVLKKLLYPNRNSLMIAGVKIRVFDATTCFTCVTTLVPVCAAPPWISSSSLQLYRPNQFDLELSTKSIR